MNLEHLLLEKSELPIIGSAHYFKVPIHPKLLDPNMKLDKDLARCVFPNIIDDWYLELSDYAKSIAFKKSRNELGSKEWIEDVFLKQNPKLISRGNSQELNILGWHNEVFTFENGFARSISISRNAGGTLYFRRDDDDLKEFVFFEDRCIGFSKEKCLEFAIPNTKGVNSVRMFVYGRHNIDNYPGALFLRNWAILYLNEAMRQVLR